jgi:hypothetical protein
MSRELKLKSGWLKGNLDRAERSVHEWNSRPVAKAQNARAQERQTSEAPRTNNDVRKKDA